MRVLFTSPPGMAHLYPLVPLAHAARTSGHEVLVATGGAALAAAAGAGLHAVDVAPGQGVDRPYRQLAETVKETELAPPELMAHVTGRFGEMSRIMIDGLVATAEAWRADAIVYPPAFPAGLLAARLSGSRAVLHGFGLRRPTFMPAMEHLRDTARNWGITTLPADPDVEINISPPSVEAVSATPDGARAETTAETLDMRYLPDNGGAELPRWLVEEQRRPRVVVTLGSMPSTIGDGEVLAEIVRGCRSMDVELVLISGSKELPGLVDGLADNVRLVDWIPVTALLGSSSAILHHGGMGTTFVSFAAGIPQVVVPHGGDRVYNAQVVEKCGAGLEIPLFGLDANRVRQGVGEVLENPRYADAGSVIAREMAGALSPHRVVSELAAIVA